MRRQELGNGGFTRYDRYNARSTNKMAIFDLRDVILTKKRDQTMNPAHALKLPNCESWTFPHRMTRLISPSQALALMLRLLLRHTSLKRLR